MKKVVFILIITMLSAGVFAQTDTGRIVTDTVLTDSISDAGEAGGINADEVTKNNSDAMGGLWIGIVGATGLALGMILYAMFFSKKKSNDSPSVDAGESKLFIDESVPQEGKVGSAAEAKKLKEENKRLKASLQQIQDEAAAYKKNLDIYQQFDAAYYNEAFKKLIVPMNEAMEKGSRKGILENMMKITAQFSSLTRYKISKKQAYDESNMQFLMNQRTKNDVAVEIDTHTPLDKIPKNIKPLIDMLVAEGSGGLDESIIAGYKIKNL